ncbi:MAG: DUF2059 domain-containing protein [Candidatus Omnitrophica bacterium]|nr:DUF2059 domain-containing protein [Candidatus Omnitrophota bacterium]
MKKIFILAVFSILLSMPAQADIIYLKNGEVIRAKILEKGNYYIKVMVGQETKQYYNEQIERIVSDEEQFQWDPSQIDANGFPEIPPTKVLLVLEHIEAIGARYNIQRNIELVLKKTPDDQKEKLKEILLITDIIRALIPVYANVYTEEELRSINAFLKTPAGSKLTNSNPEIIKSSMTVMAEYFQSRIKKENVEP